MSKPHSKLVQDSIKYLNSLPQCEAFPYTPGPYGRRSVYDILFCHKGHFGTIEIKIPPDIPTRLQQIFGRKIREAEGKSIVCSSLEEVKSFMKKFMMDINNTEC